MYVEAERGAAEYLRGRTFEGLQLELASPKVTHTFLLAAFAGYTDVHEFARHFLKMSSTECEVLREDFYRDLDGKASVPV